MFALGCTLPPPRCHFSTTDTNQLRAGGAFLVRDPRAVLAIYILGFLRSSTVTLINPIKSLNILHSVKRDGVPQPFRHIAIIHFLFNLTRRRAHTVVYIFLITRSSISDYRHFPTFVERDFIGFIIVCLLLLSADLCCSFFVCVF